GLDGAEALHPAEIDEGRRAGQAHVQEGNQALPAGQEARLLRRLGQQGEGLPDRARGRVGEGWRLHRSSATPAATGVPVPGPRTRERIRSGVTGISVILAPNGRRASSTAATTAAGDPMAPASPTPLVPPGMIGEGVTWWSRRSRGTSAAVGS